MKEKRKSLKKVLNEHHIVAIEEYNTVFLIALLEWKNVLCAVGEWCISMFGDKHILLQRQRIKIVP
jgi:hypothetical protein